MFFDEFPPVADNRPIDSLWFHQLADHSSTMDDFADELAVAKLLAGADEAVHELVIPRPRRSDRS
ncbi:MAG TPA: hypothetical protein VHW44_09775 [Pseudonocardiaceae bacterium]|jgi:hypothetical protein|nr:hypothetical protein [Pseudonocardiaceae bacterium]